ncbi:hypothetical protein QYM36_002318, partial [Artemia franciscana]
VISIDLRSQVSSSLGVYIPEGHTAKDEEEEMDYIGILNRVLPKEIQVIAWAPVEQGLSSRFDCKKRTYKYFFPKADLDIQVSQHWVKFGMIPKSLLLKLAELEAVKVELQLHIVKLAELEAVEVELQLRIVKLAELEAVKVELQLRIVKLAELQAVEVELQLRIVKLAELEAVEVELQLRIVKLAELEAVEVELQLRIVKLAELEAVEVELQWRIVKLAEVEAVKVELQLRIVKLAELEAVEVELQLRIVKLAELEAVEVELQLRIVKLAELEAVEVELQLRIVKLPELEAVEVELQLRIVKLPELEAVEVELQLLIVKLVELEAVEVELQLLIVKLVELEAVEVELQLLIVKLVELEAAMREASQYLLGTHDFRNFCKMDVGNGVINYTRNILQLTIDAPTGDDSYNMCELTIQGQAFLWHQVRCVVAILFLIGQRKENPDLVKELLDVDKNPRKPQYSMASEIPLILFDSSYEGIEWKHNQQSLKTTIKHFQELWCNYAVRATMLNKIMATLSSISVPGNLEMNKLNSQILIEGVESKVYKPIMKRQLCDSLEQKMEHFAKRFKHKN